MAAVAFAPLPRAQKRQRLLLALGAAVLGAAWLGPLPQWSQHLFTAHMGMHVLVVAVAAPLIAIGLAGARIDPVRRAPALFAPVPTSVLELVIVWAWHAPALHHAARQSALLLVAEQASFLLAGLLVWLSAFGGAHSRDRAAAGVGGLLLTSMHMTLLGVLLAGASRPLYAHGEAAAIASRFGLTALEDQQLGGVLMLAVGGTAYLAGGLVLLAALLRDRRGAPR
ncbi:cytochrome c oxidase assembly protein [Lysobacter korlensis]|uniref:Cytochrome c oxidase assembly protein n=1 Tax=Lysobacter korlensis TaxID=553636 RepID=A0ABV6RIT0_9GAMM